MTDALTGEHATSTDGIMRQFAKPGSAWFSAYKADLPHRLPYSYGGPDHPEANIAWPMMVRFRDLRDPLSVEPVDPDTIGVQRIRLETTHDPVTTGIEKRLTWLTALKGGYLSGRFTSRGSPLGLDGSNFSTEVR